MLATIATTILAYAEEAAESSPPAAEDKGREWTDPRSTKTPLVDSGDPSSDRETALDERLRKLEAKLATMSQEKIPGPQLVEAFATELKAALEDVKAIKKQARVDQKIVFKLAERAETLKGGFIAVAPDGDVAKSFGQPVIAATPGPPPDAGADQPSPTRENGSSPGAAAPKSGARATGRGAQANRSARKGAGQRKGTYVFYRTGNSRSFTLPRSLRPIKF